MQCECDFNGCFRITAAVGKGPITFFVVNMIGEPKEPTNVAVRFEGQLEKI